MTDITTRRIGGASHDAGWRILNARSLHPQQMRALNPYRQVRIDREPMRRFETPRGWATEGMERLGELVTANRKFARASEAKSGECDPAAIDASRWNVVFSDGPAALDAGLFWSGNNSLMDAVWWNQAEWIPPAGAGGAGWRGLR